MYKRQDTNCPGADWTSIDPDLADVFSAFRLTQQVHSPTRYNNVLDALATDDLVFVNSLRVDDAGLISDHRLAAPSVSALLPSRQPMLVQYRRLTNLNGRYVSPHCSTRRHRQRQPTLNRSSKK